MPRPAIAFKNATGLQHGIGPEEHPADRHDQEGVQMPERRPERFDRPAWAFIRSITRKAAVEKAPGGERPARAMPEAAQEEDGYQVGIVQPRLSTDCPPAEYDRGSRRNQLESEICWRRRQNSVIDRAAYG